MFHLWSSTANKNKLRHGAFIFVFLIISFLKDVSCMMIKIPIKAVIFDLDGTLLDTEILAAKAIQQVLLDVGCMQPYTWELNKQFLGLRGPDWSSLLINTLEINHVITPEDMVTEMEKLLNSYCNDVKLMPGALELVNKLDHLHVPMAIATSSRERAVNIKRLKHEELFSKMKYIICGDNPEIGLGKPAPDIYLYASRLLDIEPQHCLVFEDALAGVQAGKRAGMHVIACPDSRLEREPFILETPYTLPPDKTLLHFDYEPWAFHS